MSVEGPSAATGVNFTKAERLCGRIRLKEVVSTGKAVHESPIKLVGKKLGPQDGVQAQVAFAVPRRNMKRAVQRNRVRRLMREAWRLNKPHLHERLQGRNALYAWLFIYQGREPIGFQETRLKITRSLDRWLNEHG